MKKKILLLCFAFLSIFALRAQLPFFVGGYVTNLNGGAIANHTVFIMSDSNSMIQFTATAVTNGNGYYSFNNITVPAPGLVSFFIVSTYDCNGLLHSQVVSNANPQNIVNFSICNTASTVCQAGFTHIASALSNYTVNFQDVSVGSPTSWLWSFGDGTSSTLQNPVHSFNGNGPYMVCLTITTANNCTSTYCDTIAFGTGSQSCNASFIYSPSSATSLNSFNFTNTSTTTYLNYPVFYLWNFGDGTTSTLPNPTHTFANTTGGVYNVCLTMKVMSSNNTVLCQSNYCQNVVVGNTGSNCQNSFTYSNQNLVYNFTGSINSNYPTTYFWNFGDGSNGTGQNITHVFAQPPSGSNGYHVCLVTVTSNANTGTSCSDTSCVFVNVGGTTNSCTANFTYYPDSGLIANTIQFVNTSATTYQNYQILYLWNFGDGSSSTLQNPAHVFQVNPTGSYNVCLTIKVVNSAGTVVCSNTYCQNVIVGSTTNCQNSFVYTNQNLIYTFTGHVNSSNPTTYSWNFGDGTTAMGQNATHTFTQPPSGSNGYNVCLTTVTLSNTGSSCTSSSCQFVTVNNNTGGSIIQGHVYAGNYPVNNGYVLLYQANNASMSYNLLDTLALDSNAYFHYNYLNVPPVNPAFLLKAVSNATAFTQYAPTFYLHTINWFSATPVFPSANNVFYNIYMIPLPVVSTGNGTLSGSVNQTGIKGKGSNPLSGIEIILTDENDSPLKVNYSDVYGNFAFNNLAMGNYKLHIEIAGVNYTPYPVTLSSGNPTYNNITVSVSNNGAIITGIENEVNNKTSVSEIYPNPSAANEAFIEFKNQKAEKIIIDIYDNTGQRLCSDVYNVSGNQRINLIKNNLSAGIYTVKIQTSDGLNSVRKLVVSQ